MGPMTISTLIAAGVALSSDVCVSMGTYMFMRKTEDKLTETQKDPLRQDKRGAIYEKLRHND